MFYGNFCWLASCKMNNKFVGEIIHPPSEMSLQFRRIILFEEPLVIYGSLTR